MLMNDCFCIFNKKLFVILKFPEHLIKEPLSEETSVKTRFCPHCGKPLEPTLSPKYQKYHSLIFDADNQICYVDEEEFRGVTEVILDYRNKPGEKSDFLIVTGSTCYEKGL